MDRSAGVAGQPPRMLARRAQALEAEIAEIDAILEELVNETAPELIDRPGIGVDTASTLLVTAGDNPERLRSERTFAHLCGVAPIDASSGKHDHHRLGRTREVGASRRTASEGVGGGGQVKGEHSVRLNLDLSPLA